MTVKEAYIIECNNENRKIPFIAILGEDGKAESDFAEEWLDTHGDLEIRQSLYIDKYDCVYIELLNKEDK